VADAERYGTSPRRDETDLDAIHCILLVVDGILLLDLTHHLIVLHPPHNIRLGDAPLS
jgi:hypothetical protein